MEGAVRVATGCIELPAFALKGEAYECLECRRPVFPRQGEIRQAHFSHFASDRCEFYASSSGRGESEMHKRGKLVLENILKTKRDLTIRRECLRCKEPELHVIPMADIKSVHQEWAVEGGVADVVAILEDDEEIMFEVLHTHRTKERPGEWYELTAGEIAAKYASTGKILLECVRPWRCEGCERQIVEQQARREKEREQMQFKLFLERAKQVRRSIEEEKQRELEKAERAKAAAEYVEYELTRGAQQKRERAEELQRERTEFRRQMAEHVAKRIAQHELEEAEAARIEERQKEAEAALKKQKERYDAVYDDFYRRYVVEHEELPEEWMKADMWGEIRTDVEYHGCYFLNPYHIRRIKSLNK
jgi:hypothetical protein